MVLRSINVGIGTASPSSLLHVYGSTYPVLTYIKMSESTVASDFGYFRIGNLTSRLDKSIVGNNVANTTNL